MTIDNGFNRACPEGNTIIGPEAVRNQDEIKCPECGGLKAWDEELCGECSNDKEVCEEFINMEIKKEHEMEMVTTQSTVPADMIREAVRGGANLEQLEKLLTLQERWEANEARKSYHAAMAEFKANPLKIIKDKTVSFNQTSYKYATLANVIDQVSGELSKYGLSVSWQTKTNGVISVTCRITHVKGHSEETTLSADADKSGSKNSIQAMGSTISYLERYTILALLGLSTSDQDDDGQSAGKPVEYISEQQLHTIRDNLLAIEGKEEKFLAFLKVEKLELLPASDYQKAITAINAAKKKKGK